MLGLTSADPVLLLGEGDAELEEALAVGKSAVVERSAAGLDVAAGHYKVVAVTRDVARDGGRRHSLIRAAARALQGGGTLALEVPNLLSRLAHPLLVFEGLSPEPFIHSGGTTYAALRLLLRKEGFERQSGFLCLPGLADPRVILPLDSNRALASHYRAPFYVESGRRKLVRRTLGVAARLGLHRVTSPSFVILATRGGER